jgi:hypothetical protein
VRPGYLEDCLVGNDRAANWAAPIAVAVALVVAGCGGAKTVTVTQTVTRVRTVTVRAATTATTPSAAECRASSLQGSFDHIPGSEGAGNTSYRLTVTNIGLSPCVVFGVPDVLPAGERQRGVVW